MVRIWALLGPPVFVCVVAGIFTRKASSRGALATLTAGAVLGIVIFTIHGSHEVAALLPRYLRAPLNCAVVVTLICAITMMVFSRHIEDSPMYSGQEPAKTGRVPAPMTERERRTFRVVLVAFVTIWLLLIVTFSPWGIASGRCDMRLPAGPAWVLP